MPPLSLRWGRGSGTTLIPQQGCWARSTRTLRGSRRLRSTATCPTRVTESLSTAGTRTDPGSTRLCFGFAPASGAAQAAGLRTARLGPGSIFGVGASEAPLRAAELCQGSGKQPRTPTCRGGIAAAFRPLTQPLFAGAAPAHGNRRQSPRIPAPGLFPPARQESQLCPSLVRAESPSGCGVKL